MHEITKNKKTLNRRSFIAGAMAVGAAGAASFPSPAIAYGKQQWKMAISWPKIMPGVGTGAVRLAKRITELSGGMLEIIPYGAGELVASEKIFDAVSKGDVQMGYSCPLYWSSKNRAIPFFSSIPGGLTASEQNGWLYFGGGKNLWDELYGKFGLIAFPAGNTGCQMGGWFNREINGSESLSGLKMRINGIGAEIFSRFGVKIQNVEQQNLFTAMQSGNIDALEWIGPWNDMSMGFHRVSKYYYGPSFHEAGAALELMINKEQYDLLPDSLKEVIKAACAAENDILTAEYHANNIRALYEMQSKYGVEVRQYPQRLMKKIMKAAQEAVEKIADEGDMEKRIYESYTQYLQYSKEAGKYTELAYLKLREG